MRFDLANVVIRSLSTVALFLACPAIPAAESKDPFDADSILKHNRPWLHPQSKQLESIAFKHAMEPIRFDERFVWRRDGASLIELTASAYNADAVGERRATTPDRQFYFIASHSKYATAKPLPETDFDRYVRFHLMGTRCNFVALDWGWNREAFEVPRLRVQPKGLLVATFVPLQENYRINAGAMFHSSSSAYLHDLNVGSAELTIDASTHRILREVDYSPQGKAICEIDFLDWHLAGKGSEVPLQIRLRFAQYKFDVDDRFQWRDDGLWILKNSTAQFAGKPPQRETISELAINRPVPVLDEVLAQIDRGDKALSDGGVPPQQIAVTNVHRFEFGKRVVPPKSDAEKSPVRSLRFTLRPKSRFYEMGGNPDLIAEIGLSQTPSATDADDFFLITLLDKSGYPLRAVRAPVAALSLADRSFDALAQAVRQHNALWLAPKADDYPNLHYDFIGDTRHPVAVTKTSSSYLRRGVTLWLGWDSFLAEPQQYKIPVEFDAMLDGKPVIVAAVGGPPLGLRWGSGLEGVTGYHGGYTVTTAPHGLVVIDKKTSRPLVSRYGENEIHFLDYFEVKPGMHAPLRIVVFTADTRYDFHFQVVDGRAWLFDRFYSQGRAYARTEVKPPAKVTARLRADAPPVEKLVPLDWRRIVERASVHRAELPVIERIIACQRPWESPEYESLLMTRAAGTNVDGPSLAVTFDWSWILSDVRHWTLTRLTSGRPPQAFPGGEAFTMPVYPYRPGKLMAVSVPAGSLGQEWGQGGAISIKSCELNPEAGGVRAALDILGQSQMRGFWVPVTTALLTKNGTIVSAESAGFEMIIREGTVSRSQTITLPLGDVVPKYVLFGLKAVLTSEPMGSCWGHFAREEPPYPLDQLLDADDPTVWGYGASLLEKDVYNKRAHWAMRDYGAEDEKSLIIEPLKPHLDRFQRLLKIQDQPEGLAIVARLAGYSRDKRFHDALAGLLNHPHPAVKDAAAIGLGFLGDAQGMDRLRAILARPLPDDDRGEVRWEEERWQNDAVFALARIGSTDAVRTLGDALLQKVGQIHEQSTPHGPQVVGPVGLAEGIVALMARNEDPQVLDYFLRVLDSDKARTRFDRTILGYLSKRLDKADVRKRFLDGIRRGNYEYILCAPDDPAVVDAIIEVVAKPTIDPWTFQIAARWLGGSPSRPKALDALRRAFDERRCMKDARAREELITILAEHGDYRGLDEAFERLAKALDDSTLPKDAKAKEKETRERVGASNELARITIAGNFPPAVVADFLRPREHSANPAERLAVERVLDFSPAVQKALKAPLLRLPKSAVLLNHVGKYAGGYQSSEVPGFAVRFTRPDKATRAVAVGFYAYRYGESKPPHQDFHIYLMDEDHKVLKDVRCPYTQFELHKENWYFFPIPPTELPKRFIVGLSFDSTASEGICLGMDRRIQDSHSDVGTPKTGYKPVKDKCDWMIRVYVAPAGRVGGAVEKTGSIPDA
jgi:hypothetical protein